jgi:hypothetical protein
LRGNVNIRPSSFSIDLDSIRESRSSGMSPARSTVRRDVLVPDIGQVGGVIDVVPDPLFWEVFNVLERFSRLARLRGTGRSSARMLRINKFEGRSDANKSDKGCKFHL